MAIKPKSKPRNKKLTYLLVLLLFLFVCFSYYAYQIVYTDNVDTKGKPTYVRIRKGQTYEAVMDSIEAKNVIIATGSKARHLPGIPVDNRLICDNEGALAFDTVPERLGVIAYEQRS